MGGAPMMTCDEWDSDPVDCVGWDALCAEGPGAV